MYEAFPIWVLVVDYVLGAVMWTLVGRFGMGLFLPEDSQFAFMRFFVRATNPLLRLFAPVTPRFPHPAGGAALRRVVLLHGSLLRDAVAPRILGDGHAVLSAGERDRAKRRAARRLLRELNAEREEPPTRLASPGRTPPEGIGARAGSPSCVIPCKAMNPAVTRTIATRRRLGPTHRESGWPRPR